MKSSPMKNHIALRYLDNITDGDRSPLQPTSKHNKYPEEDLDKLAMQLNTTSTPTRTALLRTKFETPSVTVSSFKTPSNISSSSNTSSRSGSPIKRNLKSFETPIKKSSNLLSLKSDLLKNAPSTPYLSSPGNSADVDSPGYEYLCRILSIKIWLEQIINEEIDKSPAELISDVRNGIILAKLANVILPTKRSVFTNPKLQFRHTENINRFFKLMDFMSVPDLFVFELTDLYDAKNVPKVWFCLHAMSYMLHKSNPEFPKIDSLVGKCTFTPEDIRTANRALVGTGLPNFSSADNDDDANFESSYMNRAIESSSPKKFGSPGKFGSPERSLAKLAPSAKDSIVFESPFKRNQLENPFTDKSNTKTKYEDIIKTPINRQPNSPPSTFHTPEGTGFETDYKDSIYYTPEIDQHLGNIVKLQALSRGAGLRYRMFINKILIRSYSDEFTHFHSIIRGNMARMRTIHRHRDEVMLYKHDINDLQAIARSKLLRKRLDYHFDSEEHNITKFQAILRGTALRTRLQRVKFDLLNTESSIIELQAQMKMLLVYPKVMTVLENKDDIEPAIVKFQSVSRRIIYQRSKISNVFSGLKNCGGLIELQALIRGKRLRKEFFSRQYFLSKYSNRIGYLQSIARGGVVRTRLCNNVLITLLHEDEPMNQLFAKARGNFARKSILGAKDYIAHFEDEIIEIQSIFRGVLTRFQRDIKLEDCYSNIEEVIDLQSIVRGNKIRAKLNSIDAYYYRNMDKLIKAQSYIKSNFAKRAYQSLITMKNPPLSIIRKFAYLLSDNDMDFEQEMELAELKDKIIERSKTNEELEAMIENLDIKLGLLDKNKISIEDFVKDKFKPTSREIDDEINIKNIEKLNKSSRERVEAYQSLFYLLQTKPNYLVRLHENVDVNTKHSAEFRNLQKNLVLLFPVKDSSVTHHSREEFFLVKLILALMESDCSTRCKNLTDLTKSNVCYWIDYLLHFNNHTYQRLHLKSLLGKVISAIIDDDEVDFESDPSVINSSLIERDMRIQGFSDRNAKATSQAAIKDPEVSNHFVENLMNLREFTNVAFTSLEMNIDRVPLHIKVICSKAYELSKITFPDRSEQQHLSVAGVIFIKHYVSNLFQNPENFGFMANDPFTPGLFRAKAKSNLNAVARVLKQIFSLKPFSDNFLKPLNEYVTNSVEIARSLISRIIDVDNLEVVYNLNDYDDIVTHDRPKLSMKVSDMVQIEKVIQNNIDIVAPSFDDQLYVIVNRLNSAVNSAKDLVSISELGHLTLLLNPTTKEESIADSKGNALFTQVKRSVLYIIRVQEGDELLELLVAGITPEHEESFKTITTEEKKESESGTSVTKKKAYHKTSLGDLTKITYHELKKNALETILQLEFMGLVSRNDSYQAILNQIAVDIKTKHQQRITRKSQLEIAIKTSKKLAEKESVLKKQHNDYKAHVENILSELQLKPKDKKLFNVIPIFSKQYFYHRELKKSNRLPKFGSYKYSAKKLMEQNVLVDFGGAMNARYSNSSKLDFMFSCHSVGKFTIEAASGSVNIPGAFTELSLDDLLNLQYENKPRLEAFDGMVIFDTDHLASFIFKKFYDLKKD